METFDKLFNLTLGIVAIGIMFLIIFVGAHLLLGVGYLLVGVYE